MKKALEDYPVYGPLDLDPNNYLLEDDPDGLPSVVGRDPRVVSRDELKAQGHRKRPLPEVIRDRCLRCRNYSRPAVRACARTTCSSWPYRMGTDPFSDQPMPDVQRQSRAAPNLAEAGPSGFVR
jgi:hypothetical protein